MLAVLTDVPCFAFRTSIYFYTGVAADNPLRPWTPSLALLCFELEGGLLSRESTVVPVMIRDRIALSDAERGEGRHDGR